MVCAGEREQERGVRWVGGGGGKEETNKHKDGSLSPVRSSYFLSNLRVAVATFSDRCWKRCQTCRRPAGKGNKILSLFFLFIFAHHLAEKKKKKTTKRTYPKGKC